MTTHSQVITVHRDLLADQHARADEFRAAMTRQGTFVVNVLSSPGSGKTTLLASLLDQWRERQTSDVAERPA